MNIKIKDATKGKVWVVECKLFGLTDDNNRIKLMMPNGFTDMISTEPLKAIDNLMYDAWTKQLEEHNHLDLTTSGYLFEDVEDDEDNED